MLFFFFFHPLSNSELFTALLLSAVCFGIEDMNMRYCYVDSAINIQFKAAT